MKITVYLLLLSSSILWGCSHQPAPDNRSLPPELAHASTTVASMPNFRPDASTTFHWQQDLAWGTTGQSASFDANKLLVQNQIGIELRRKGYQVKRGGLHSGNDYLLYAAVVTDSYKNADDIMAFFKLHPDLGQESTRYEKGTLIVAAVRPGAQQASWRGAIKAFVDPTQSLPAEVRATRLERLVQRLMSNIPKA